MSRHTTSPTNSVVASHPRTVATHLTLFAALFFAASLALAGTRSAADSALSSGNRGPHRGPTFTELENRILELANDGESVESIVTIVGVHESEIDAIIARAEESIDDRCVTNCRGLQRRLTVYHDDDVGDDTAAVQLYETMTPGNIYAPDSLQGGGSATQTPIVGLAYGADSVARGPLSDAMAGVTFFDENGNMLGSNSIDPLPSFQDPGFQSPQLLIDEQGRTTLFYSDLPDGLPPRVLGQRIDPITGDLIGTAFVVSPSAYYPSAALLSDDGNQALVVFLANPNVINGVLVDLSEDTRGTVVGPEFSVSTTPSAFTHYAPVVAADRISGTFMVAWEDISGMQFDAVNIRGRRFNADGTPIDANDFVINTMTSDSQSQPTIGAFQGLGAFAVAWTSDGTSANDLDIFIQIFKDDGTPLSPSDVEITNGTDIQDRPALQVLDERDSQNRPIIAITHRDVANVSGTPRPGESGARLVVLAVDGLTAPVPPIFVDGFESGDTTAWSSSSP